MDITAPARPATLDQHVLSRTANAIILVLMEERAMILVCVTALPDMRDKTVLWTAVISFGVLMEAAALKRELAHVLRVS